MNGISVIGLFGFALFVKILFKQFFIPLVIFRTQAAGGEEKHEGEQDHDDDHGLNVRFHMSPSCRLYPAAWISLRRVVMIP